MVALCARVVDKNRPNKVPRGGMGGYSHILAIRVCAAGKSKGLVIIENWSRNGFRLADKSCNNKRLNSRTIEHFLLRYRVTKFGKIYSSEG